MFDKFYVLKYNWFCSNRANSKLKIVKGRLIMTNQTVQQPWQMPQGQPQWGQPQPQWGQPQPQWGQPGQPQQPYLEDADWEDEDDSFNPFGDKHKAGMLPPSGLLITIKGIELKKNNKYNRKVVFLVDSDGMKLEMNQTRNTTLFNAFGLNQNLKGLALKQEYDKLIGKQIRLFPAMASNGRPTINIAPVEEVK